MRHATSPGRRMIVSAMRAQAPPSLSGRRPISGTRSRSRREPNIASSAGSSVRAALMETSGMSRPPMPIERMNGSGIRTSMASPMATVAPEKSTARPAVFIVVRSAVALVGAAQ